MEAKDIIPILAPLATLSVGVGTCVIAFNQWMVARNKLRLDLYKERYKVYEATKSFIAVSLNQSFDEGKLVEFNQQTKEAEFLFGEDITSYIKTIRKNALSIRTCRVRYEHIPVGEERTKLCEKEHDLIDWFITQSTDEAVKKFSLYLKFSEINGNNPLSYFEGILKTPHETNSKRL